MKKDIKFKDVSAFLLNIEGGLSLDPDDNGNWTSGVVGKGILKGTKHGISAATYPNLDIKSLTKKQAEELYENDFWIKFNVESFPSFIRPHYFDVCVNSGNSRAVKILQRAIGAVPDGIVGKETRRLLSGLTVKKFERQRSDFYVNHAILNPGKLKYLAGWIGRIFNVTEFTEKFY